MLHEGRYYTPRAGVNTRGRALKLPFRATVHLDTYPFDTYTLLFVLATKYATVRFRVASISYQESIFNGEFNA